MVAYLVQMVMEGTSCYRSLWRVSVIHDIGKEKGGNRELLTMWEEIALGDSVVA